MASSGLVQAAVLLVAVQLVCLGAADADQDTGTVIPAESRPCVDCHAFEFMQRALQDLKKTAFNLDARVSEAALSWMLWSNILYIFYILFERLSSLNDTPADGDMSVFDPLMTGLKDDIQTCSCYLNVVFNVILYDRFQYMVISGSSSFGNMNFLSGVVIF
uniref:NELL2-interacting cell ontogeny regulator 1 n=1 Tax=Acanthochromis polyacanthus TaxID=80966 RepID=A0A3Q1F569_9TELE